MRATEQGSAASTHAQIGPCKLCVYSGQTGTVCRQYALCSRAICIGKHKKAIIRVTVIVGDVIILWLVGGGGAPEQCYARFVVGA